MCVPHRYYEFEVILQICTQSNAVSGSLSILTFFKSHVFLFVVVH